MSHDDLTGQLLADLRIRLLDLRNSNKLLNYTHSERAKTQVRIIAAQPDFLYGCLTSGKSLSFRPLPEPEGELPDERSDDFLMALDEAHRLDPAWIALNQEEEDITSDKALRLDRAIRDRVRSEMGLPPAKGGRLSSIADWARLNGIEPTFDLPHPAVDEDEGDDVDKEIQTLLLPDNLQGKLAGVLDETRTAQQEMGVNLLHLAIGFLEWVETPQAEKSMIAPLLLYPVELDRKPMKAKGQYRYYLRGDAEPMINITLLQRMAQDYNLIVPPIEEGDTAESYMAQMTKVIEGKPRWRVRRFSTLGLFSFSRLVMFNDLAPDRWGGEGGLAKAGVLGEVFGRKEAGDPTAETYDIEDPAVEAEVPLLIRDADSSQHQAIIDVMRGRNLVIKGPPGTGKSQTIANIIAAALAKRRKVLFVAEKTAALDVVKKRLDDAGLGEFCFELHSTKAKKSEVLAGLERRLNLTPARAASSITASLDELQSLRKRLTKHAVTMNRPFSALEVCDRGIWRKMTIHDILWAEQRTRAIIPRFQGLDRVFLADAIVTARFDAERRRDRLLAIEQIVSETIDRFGGVNAHPWSFVTRPSLQVLDVPEVVDAVGRAKSALELLSRAAAPLDALKLQVPETLADLKVFGEMLSSLPLPEPMADDHVLRLILKDPTCEEAVRAIIADLLARTEALAERDQLLVSGTTTISKEVAASLANRAKVLGLSDLTLNQIAGKAAQARRELIRLNNVVMLAKSLFSVLGIHGAISPRTLRLAVQATDLIARTERNVLLGRIPSVVEETSHVVLERAHGRLSHLRAKDTELRERFVFDASVSVIDLRRHAGVLKTTGTLGKFGGEFKTAKKTALAILKGSEKFAEGRIAELLIEMAEHLEARQAFDGDQALRAICQHRFVGLETDIESLLAANRFSTDVRSTFAGLGDAETAIRRFLLHGDVESLDGLKAIAADDRFAELRQLVSDATHLDADLAERCSALERLGLEADALCDTLSAGGLRADATPAQADGVTSILARIEEVDTRLVVSQGPAVLGKAWRGGEIDPAALEAALRCASALRAHASDGAVCQAIAVRFNAFEAAQDLRETGKALEERAGDALSKLSAALELVVEERLIGHEIGVFATKPLSEVVDLLHRAGEEHDELMRWVTLRRGITDARADSLGPLLDAYDEAHEPYLRTAAAYDRVLHRSLARRVMELYPDLGAASALSLDDIRRRFQELDRRIMDMRRLELVSSLAAAPIPQGIQSPKKGECTEASLIRNELAKKKKHIPLRDLLDRAQGAIRALKPCTMMSPASVAQFLKAGQTFDLVIIDEASQMRPEEAISTLARAKQAVIVGDSQQLPPSNHFGRQSVDGQLDEESEFEKVVAESVLDVASTAFQPLRELLWHYRSRHGSLIAFSNRHFYGDRLIVFPSPQEGHPEYGVKFMPVTGQYRASVNVPEANVVAQAAVDFMAKNPDKSLGIVALNQPQRDLILAEMDRLFVRNTVAEYYRARWAPGLEPFFVKNLENVQGDERDVIFISTVYGPDEQGNLMQRFGDIVGGAGDRRLNVLFSRAKHGVKVFSSMRPDQIRVGADTPRGTRLLKDYLQFAATGRLESGTEGVHQECDSDFERFVKERLEAKGYEVVAQVGVAGFRIDLGVRHPKWPYGFLVGIECDGAAYHSSLSARDRDRLRQQILESLGWTIYRVWSTDWFRDQNREMAKMSAFIEQTLRDCLSHRVEEQARHEAQVLAQGQAPEIEDLSSPFTESDDEDDGEDEVEDSSDVLHHAFPSGSAIRP
ncbi:MAG: DUF4011 domain-containing protein [Acidocella sp.]|nr:DUF4011 domain-containing protein [Acidocella sp.]